MKAFLLLFILLVPLLVVAQPPHQQNHAGLLLQVSYEGYHKVGTDKYVHTHVYDRETSIILDPSDLDCFYHVYSYNLGGEHIIDNGVLSPEGVGLEDTIDGSYFNEIGYYSILMWCELTDETEGGFYQYTFEVNNIGYERENSFYLMLFLGLFIIFGFLTTIILFAYKQFMWATIMLPLNALLIGFLFQILYLYSIILSSLYFTLYIIFMILFVALLLFAMYELIYQLLSGLNKKRQSTFGDNL